MSTTDLHVKLDASSQRSIFSSSIPVWLLLVGYLVLVKIVILPLFPPIAIPAVAAIFDWSFILTAGLMGLAGLWLETALALCRHLTRVSRIVNAF